MKNDFIVIKNARENNLQNISLKIPKNKLVVFTGVSGSGKSSLAFNTIYEEGRRRYIDSLSSYARQFLGNAKRPLVDAIDGLVPAISIEQKTVHNNPRSTVGTITEIYDFLRLLYARIGIPYCPKHKIKIESQTQKNIIKDILKNEIGSKLHILSPVINAKKGSHEKLIIKLRDEGFVRLKIDGKIHSIDEEIKLEKNLVHNIDIIIDRLILKKDSKSRIAEAIEIALENNDNGIVLVENIEKKIIKRYSKFFSCPYCDFNMPTIEPRLFSFNSPFGMCQSCKGLGVKLKADFDKIVINKNLSINRGAITIFKNSINTKNIDWQEFNKLLEYYEIEKDKPINEMSSFEKDIICNGSKEKINYVIYSKSGNKYEKNDYIEGIAKKIERRHLNSSSELLRNWYRNNFMSDIKCSTCKGTRLNENALALKISKMNISQFTNLSIEDAIDNILNLELNDYQKQISQLIVNELLNRLNFLKSVGLEYLTLDRKAESLSGGESQRIRLATQIGSKLTGILYVLDEPSIGLHQKDNQKLIESLKKMVDIGNSLIVVEHDEDTIRASDWIIDIGPKAGDEGGKIVAEGKIENILKASSITGDFLSKRKKISWPKTRNGGNGKILIIKKACENNLRNIDVIFPLGKLILVTGVSGSGKSTLVNEILFKAIQQKISNPFIKPGKFKEIINYQNIDKIIRISQSPIGKTSRSNPATYISVFDDIRDLFALTNLAKSRAFTKSRFSFNVDGGRCEKCRGDGNIKIQMHFLPDIYIKCDNCDGKRYNEETLQVKYKNKNIFDVLDMRAKKAYDFFDGSPKIKQKLKTMIDVGLGYVKLGQSSTTLSGGESQRIKLSKYLQKKSTGKTLYVIDEPTTGLHQYDVKKLIKILISLRDKGESIVVIEHNLDVIKVADHIIDLGPGGGKNGGKVIATGTPEQVMKNKNSFTGIFLKNHLLNDLAKKEQNG